MFDHMRVSWSPIFKAALSPAFRESIICTEDQWNIYNLDPAYQCLVMAPPLSPVIFRKVPRVLDQHAEASGLYSHQAPHERASSQ